MAMKLIYGSLIVLGLAIAYSILKPFMSLSNKANYKGYSTTKKIKPSFIKEAQKEKAENKAQMDERKTLMAKHGNQSKVANTIAKRKRVNELQSRKNVKTFK